VFIGLRSTEAEEEKIITKEEIKAFRPDDIKRLGIEEVTRQTLHHLRGCQYLYVSFDVDSLDSGISMGTGTPVENGLSVEEAVCLLKTFLYQQNLAGFEITEINPALDPEKPMQHVIAGLVEKIFS